MTLKQTGRNNKQHIYNFLKYLNFCLKKPLLLTLIKCNHTIRTLNVSISDQEYLKYGIKKDQLSFAEILDIVNREQFREHLKKSVELAKECGLSEMTMEEIDEEVKAIRANAKTCH